MPAKPKTTGRPSTYSKAAANRICAALAEGKTLTEICAQKGAPSVASVYRWLDSTPLFREDYARARSKQADTYAEMIITESRTAKDAQIGRLRMDALKWAASKLAPRKYGDKIEHEVSGEVDIVVRIGGAALGTGNDRA